MKVAPAVFLGLGLVLPTPVWGQSVANELGVGTTQTTPINPRSGYLYDRLTGVVDMAETVSLRLEVVGTHDIATSPQHGARFQLVGREIFSASAALDWDLSRHFYLSIGGDFSPTSSTSSDAPVQLASTSADALIHSTSNAYGLSARVGYDTASDSDYQTLVDGSLSLVHFTSRQSVIAVESDGGPLPIQGVIDSCYLTQQSGCDEYVNAAMQRDVNLNQYRVSASVTESIYQTDLSLGGAYYWYDHDPRTLGYFSLATLGRTFASSAGLPSLAPLRYTLRPGLGHAFGAMRMDLWYQYGQYAHAEGRSHGGGLRLQYKFSRPVSAWLRLDGQDSIDHTGEITISGLVVLGLRVRF